MQRTKWGAEIFISALSARIIIFLSASLETPTWVSENERRHLNIWVSGGVSAAAIRKSEEATDSQRPGLVGLLELVADNWATEQKEEPRHSSTDAVSFRHSSRQIHSRV